MSPWFAWTHDHVATPLWNPQHEILFHDSWIAPGREPWLPAGLRSGLPCSQVEKLFPLVSREFKRIIPLILSTLNRVASRHSAATSHLPCKAMFVLMAKSPRFLEAEQAEGDPGEDGVDGLDNQPTGLNSATGGTLGKRGHDWVISGSLLTIKSQGSVIINGAVNLNPKLDGGTGGKGGDAGNGGSGAPDAVGGFGRTRRQR